MSRADHPAQRHAPGRHYFVKWIGDYWRCTVCGVTSWVHRG